MNTYTPIPRQHRRNVPHRVASALLFLSFVAGCNSLPAPIEGKEVRVAFGADPVVVNAEQTAKASLDTIEWFLKVDNKHRDRMREEFPDAHRTAEHLRRNFPAMVSQLRETTKKYKASRDVQTGETLQDQLMTVQQEGRGAWARLMELREAGVDINP